jgi:hypothetical protein
MTYDYRGDPMLGPILEYWARKRGDRPMPSKRDIDATELPPKLLPNLQIIDVIDEGARFRYRLIGTAVVEAYGSDYTEKFADELFPDDRLGFIQNIYRTVCNSKSPLFTQNRYHTPKNVVLSANRIYMPLSDDGVNVHHILGVLHFEFGHHVDGGVWGKGAVLDPSEQYIELIEMGDPGPLHRRAEQADS